MQVVVDFLVFTSYPAVAYCRLQQQCCPQKQVVSSSAKRTNTQNAYLWVSMGYSTITVATLGERFI